ncbi:oligosaccharide flippase family protein [Geodermatophilus maliterrae]|uniref:Oligosaccharide flippase family protein n=1 Tax=Geodermatophilus maliterrae TaxID=3162531 RepID=A0ABV3XJJ9_9ACTN
MTATRGAGTPKGSPAGTGIEPAEATDPGVRRSARAVLLLSIAEVVGKVVTLALLLYAVRVLTPAEFGSFSYALSFGMLLAVLPAWGLDALLVQQVGADRSRLPGQYAQLLLLRTMLAVPVVVLGAAAGALTRPTAEDRFALVAMLVAAVLESYAHAPRNVAGVLRRQSTVALVLVGQRLLTAGAAIGALAAGWGLVGLSSAYVAITLLGTAALFLVVARAGGRPSWTGITKRTLGRTARLSVPLGIDALVAMFLFRAHTLMLGWFHGDTAVAEYTPPYRLVETVLFVTWAVSRVTYPAMASAADLASLRRALSSGLSVTAFVFAPFAALMIVRGPDVLALLFGDYYADTGATVLRVLALTPLAFAVGYLFSYAFVAQGRNGVALVTSLIAAVANLVANLLLLPPLSTLGAALTTTGSYLLEALLLVAVARRSFGALGMVSALALPMLSSVPAAAVALIPLPVLPALVLAGACYLAVWLLAARRWQPANLAVLMSVVPGRRK